MPATHIDTREPLTASMNLMSAIYGRRSIRDYEPRELSREVIGQLIADAVQAPNSINRQAWSFSVLTGRELLADISRSAKAYALSTLSDAPPQLRSLLESETFDIFYNASALVVIVATQPDPMVAQDCCLAGQTLMLAAHARGLGSCWIGFAEGWLNTAEGKQRLGAPADHVAVAPIIIGYPRTIPEPTGRRAPQISWIAK